MSDQGVFTVEGVILEVLPNRTCRVGLANGHKLLAYVAGRAKFKKDLPGPGAKVRVRLSPCDLSQGRLMIE